MNTVKKLQDLSRNRPWLTFLVLVTLGTMMFLLLGCGSDSTPKGAASAKKEKSAKSDGAVKAITPLLLDKAVGTAPPLQPGDKHPLTLSPEQVEALRRDAVEREEKFDPKREFLPGLTLEQLNAKHEAERAKKPNPNLEVLPGLTAGQLEAKRAEAEKRASMAGEILPGLTAEQARAGAEQAKQRQEAGRVNPDQLFPPGSPQPERKVVK